MKLLIKIVLYICPFLLLFTVCGIQAAFAGSLVSSGLMLWYDMNDTGSTLTDRSNNGNPGTVYGALYDLLPSGAGEREFDGYNDHIKCNNSPGISPAGGLTVEVLFRPGRPGSLQTLVSKSASGATGDGYTMWINSNNDLQFLIYDRNHKKVVVSARPGFTKTNWYHATAVYNGANVTLYVNGVKYSTAVCGGFSPSTMALTIGKYAPSSSLYFDGDIATVRIYDRALTASEVLSNYKADQWRVTTTTHPFLLFHDIANTPGYKYRSSQPWSGWEEGILDSANIALTKDFTDPTWATSWEADNWVSARGQYAMNLGLAYQITKDKKYADKAKQALLDLDVGEVPEEPNSMIPEEFKAMSLLGYSLAYDWVQPALDIDSDKAIRDKLAVLADDVYGDLNWDGTKRSYITFCDFQGQAYPTLGIAGVVLHDYVNPHKLALRSMPSDWVKAATTYYFVNDGLHDYGQSLLSFEVDDAGKDMMGAYRAYYIDDLSWWAQVYSYYYQKNFLNTYPLAKKALTAELWSSLPNGYSGDLATDSNLIYAYHSGIANLLDTQDRSYILKYDDLVKDSNLLPYSREASHIYYDTEMPDALYYLVALDYSKVARSSPPYSSHLDDDSVYQVIREGWTTDSDWLSLVTYEEDTPTYSWRSAAHHDQMSIEYYSHGDLLLADAGEDRNILDRTYGRGESSHNTIAIENPRLPFTASSWANSNARGIFKGTRAGVETPVDINILAQTPWMVIADTDTAISEIISTFDTAQKLSSPINYERTVLYPDRDYMILVDRLEGMETWTYRTIFRPSSLSITPTEDKNGDGLYSGSEVGHVNLDLAVGPGSYDWRSMAYKKENATGIKTSSVAWTTTNPYGQAVGMKLYSVPSSEIRVTKLVGRVAGPDVRSEVLVPVVYYRSAPSKTLYRATVLLPAYADETKKVPQAITVSGNGNALQVKGQGHIDYIYTGKGASWFASYKTDADTVFIRARNGNATEITFLNGSYVSYAGAPIITLSGRADYFTFNKSGTSFSFKVRSAGTVSVTVSKLDPKSGSYTVLKDGKTYTGWTKVDGQTLIITNSGGEHKYDIT
ncbi:conserved hypothetical protein [Methanocella paludicola SANAE]|uniref:LamG-like jellyroll fold domain-containing protein n=1 Tax=Methanocella paludicola (strain DSM 17711 / JCM 13418 / NBRC 101707 / SANAE) TaxID=304371 RepID=D1YWT9_METPS|nr:LamG-like jellyroll fold domain-containing protein [Methanocella paludicola]BAI60911.1 conserved hypothetical protein [Methanocella paludicola SANAE]